MKRLNSIMYVGVLVAQPAQVRVTRRGLVEGAAAQVGDDHVLLVLVPALLVAVRDRRRRRLVEPADLAEYW